MRVPIRKTYLVSFFFRTTRSPGPPRPPPPPPPQPAARRPRSKSTKPPRVARPRLSSRGNPRRPRRPPQRRVAAAPNSATWTARTQPCTASPSTMWRLPSRSIGWSQRRRRRRQRRMVQQQEGQQRGIAVAWIAAKLRRPAIIVMMQRAIPWRRITARIEARRL